MRVYVCVYIAMALYREENDLDMLFNSPAHIWTANLERQMLLAQIEKAKTAGQDVTLLQAELDYVDVKETAMRVKEEARARRAR